MFRVLGLRKGDRLRFWPWFRPNPFAAPQGGARCLWPRHWAGTASALPSLPILTVLRRDLCREVFKPTLPATGHLRPAGRLLTDTQRAGPAARPGVQAGLPGQVCSAAPSRLPAPLPGSQQDKQPRAFTRENGHLRSEAGASRVCTPVGAGAAQAQEAQDLGSGYERPRSWLSRGLGASTGAGLLGEAAPWLSGPAPSLSGCWVDGRPGRRSKFHPRPLPISKFHPRPLPV